MIKAEITVTITKIKVDVRYYSFNYKITRNGKLHKKDEYSSSHDWGTDYLAFKDLLEDSVAVKLALDRY